MPTEPRDVIRRFYDEIWNRGDLAVADEIVAEDVVDHNPPPGLPSGRVGAKLLFAAFHAGFPDLHVTVGDVFGDGDRVAARGMLAGTHRGAFMGMPATDRSVDIAWIDLFRVHDGRIAEVWHLEDVPAMLTQLGVMAGPPGPPPA